MAWRCRFVEPTEKVRIYLRRYVFPSEMDEHTELRCGRPGRGYHHAISADYVAVIETDDVIDEGDLPHVANLDKRWPKECACGFKFRRHDPRQIWRDRVWRCTDDGEEIILRTAPPGIMWHAPWRGRIGRGGDGLALMVRLPDGNDWHIDGPESGESMTIPLLRTGWVRRGKPPLITVTPSIHTPGYHGTLTDGVLSDDSEGRTYAT